MVSMKTFFVWSYELSLDYYKRGVRLLQSTLPYISTLTNKPSIHAVAVRYNDFRSCSSAGMCVAD